MIRRPPRSTLFPYNDALPIYHRAVAGPRLLPVHVGHLRADGDGLHDRHRQLRVVLPPVPRVHQGDALALGGRGEGDPAPPDEGRGAWRPSLRPCSACSPTWTPPSAPWRSCARRATTISPCTRRSRCTRSRTCWSATGR